MHCNDTPPLTSRHKDGWKLNTYLEALSRDDAFATALATFISNIDIGDVPATTADYLASATLVALLNEEERGGYTCTPGAPRTGFRPPYPSPCHGLHFCEAGMQMRDARHQGRHRKRHRPLLVCIGVQGGMRVPTMGPTCCDGGGSRVRPCGLGCH